MIIEFAGMPRSGKSSAIEFIRDCLVRSGRTARIVGEAARSSPFDSKYRLEMASWAANKALNSVLEAAFGLPRETVILQDRGLFDSLAFLRLLQVDPEITVAASQSELNLAIETALGYFSNPVWTNHIDLVIFLDVSVKKATQRDLALQICGYEGVVTNTESLACLQQAYADIQTRYRGQFADKIKTIVTTNMTQAETACAVMPLVEEAIKDKLCPRQ